jgi:hypothetical protein
MEYVTRDAAGELVVVEEDYHPASDPCPVVDLHASSAYIDSGGTLHVSLEGTVFDALSDVLRNDADKVQSLTFYVNDEEVATISNLPSENQAAPEPPWKPYKYEPTFEQEITIPNVTAGDYVVRAETSENLMGNVGSDSVTVSVGLQGVPGSGGATTVTLTANIYLPAEPTPGAADSLQFYYGDRGVLPDDPVLTEDTAEPASLVFAGTIDGTPTTVTITEFSGLTTALDTLTAEVRYDFVSGGSSTLTATFTETGAETNRFSVTYTFPVGGGGIGTQTPVLQSIEEDEGTDAGTFFPLLTRMTAAPGLFEEDPDAYSVDLLGADFAIRPFAYSPDNFYVVDTEDKTVPTVVVVVQTGNPRRRTSGPRTTSWSHGKAASWSHASRKAMCFSQARRPTSYRSGQSPRRSSSTAMTATPTRSRTTEALTPIQ